MAPTNYKNIELTPEPEQVGLRIDQALGKIEPIQSRSRAEHLIDEKLVTVNGRPVKASYRLQAGDEIKIQIPLESESQDLRPLALPLEILFEDEDVLVINKPSGLVVHPAAGHTQDTLVNALIHHSSDFKMKFNQSRPGIVHRLDKDTSGVLVVGKNDFAVENLVQQFKNRTVHRLYEAVVKTTGLAKPGTIQSYLIRNPSDRKKYSSLRSPTGKIIREKDPKIQNGKWAVTHYKLIKKVNSGLGLLELKLETGRTHQIRVHLSEMGWSVLGDAVYGKNHSLKPPRLCLHAKVLSFEHPRSKKFLSFQQDWPEDIKPFILEMGL